MKIAIIVGSLRRESYNHKLASAIAGRFPDGTELEWVSADVPLFSADLEPDAVPESVKKAVTQVHTSDAVLLISPEYNRSFSGVIKNLLDWLSRESVGYPLDGKLGAVAGATNGQIGTAVMQSQLRPILAHIGMDIVSLPEVFISVPSRMSEAGEITDRTAVTLEKLVEAIVARIATK